jgi:hypothetical protein
MVLPNGGMPGDVASLDRKGPEAYSRSQLTRTAQRANKENQMLVLSPRESVNHMPFF